MKLLVEEVRENGPLDLDESLPSDRMTLDSPDHSALTAPVRIHVHAETLDDEILALIKAETRVSMDCSRCLARFERPLKANLELHVPATAADVEVEEEVRQSFLLGLPVKPLCRPDCKGLCTKCGKELNAGPCACADDRREGPFAALKDLKPR
jgi:uncharacterized protein